jgi:16S rRNA (adenine1518-N6/adenine1519-N6)-dimethyltransferase
MNLAQPKELKQFLGRHGIKADKGLGQHFLCSEPAVDAIVESVHEAQGILEIGPGPGILTGPLSHEHGRVIALEVDPRMVELLQESAPMADVRLQDAMRADLPKILRELPSPRALVSNLPYYITGPLLTRIAEARGSFDVAVLMMQREVAERVLAQIGDRNRGSLSVFLQLQFRIELVRRVPAGSFLPPPKVDSTILQFFPEGNGCSGELQRLIRIGFAQPRKTLVNNLVSGYRVQRPQALEWVTQLGHQETARPSDIALAEWNRLSGMVSGQPLRTRSQFAD